MKCKVCGAEFKQEEIIDIEKLREYICDHICVHAAEDSDYLEERCKECRLEELTKI